MKKFDELTTAELWQLRNEIVLNSLFIADYCNSFGFSPKSMCDFFDGYVSFIYELATEDGHEDLEIVKLCELYDNADNLQRWYYCFDDFSWVEYEEID